MRALAGNQEEAFVLLYDALMGLRSFMWSEGYADQVKAMAKADAAIAKAEEDSGLPEGCVLVDYGVSWQAKYQRLTGHNAFRISEWPGAELTEDQKTAAVSACNETEPEE